jgi:hypothetical protein
MIQYKRILQCNPPHKQTKGENDMIVSLDAEKAFHKI